MTDKRKVAEILCRFSDAGFEVTTKRDIAMAEHIIRLQNMLLTASTFLEIFDRNDSLPLISQEAIDKIAFKKIISKCQAERKQR